MKSQIFKQMNKRPVVAVSLGGRDRLIDCARKAVKLGADLIEIRIDTLQPGVRGRIGPLLARMRKASGLPLIGTVRSPGEREPGSKGQGLREEERMKIYRSILPHVELVDVEILSDSINERVIREAHRLGKKVILSYHDFQAMPSQEMIDDLAGRFRRLSGDILKIAGTPSNKREVGTFLNACLSLNGIRRIFIAMGDLGIVSRLMGFSFGSCLTYGRLNRATAPGQIALGDLVQCSRALYPPSRHLLNKGRKK